MDPFFDEHYADQQVIKSLLKALTRRYEMSQLIQDAEGNLLAVHNWEELTVEAAHTLVDKLQADLDKVQTWLTAREAKLSAETPAPVVPETPVAPEQPVPAEPVAPVEPAQVAPAVDAAGNPITLS